VRFVALVFIAALFADTALAAQGAQQRLAIEQQQVADQLRRLNTLLIELETSERQLGNIELADTLASVQSYMNGAEGVGDLVLAIQKVSEQLQQHRNASALSSQAVLIEQLQLLLDMLLNSQADIQSEKQKELLEQRAEKIKDLIDRQQQLLEEVQQLKKEQSDPSENDEQKMQELQEQQEQLAEDTKEFNKQQQQQGIKSEPAEDAQQKQEEAASELEQQDMQQAEEKQEEALDKLKEAQQDVEQQQQQDASKEKQEALMNVEQEIKEILLIHDQQHLVLEEVLKSNPVADLPRSARVKLRKVSAIQQNISYRADDLLLEIAQAGADSFPFYILALMEDHQILADNLVAISDTLNQQDVELSKYLSESWAELLDVIATERDREREQAESDSQDEESQEGGEDEEDAPLVQFATELQLLKRMQLALAKRMHLVQNNPGGDTFKRLIERQTDLQLQYESMIRRLQGAADKTDSEEI